MTPVPRSLMLLAGAALIVGIAAGAYLILAGGGDDRFAQCRRGALAGGVAEIGGEFTLTGASGARVRSADVVAGPTLIYFGYTFCPDFCPTDLARNATAADILAERGVDVGQVFVTIDPERDTPQVVGEYAAALHPDLIGLTGSEADVAAAATAFRVYFRKADDDPEYYLVDHSTFTYLVAPDQPFLEFYSSDVTPQEVADSVACFAARL